MACGDDVACGTPLTFGDAAAFDELSREGVFTPFRRTRR